MVRNGLDGRTYSDSEAARPAMQATELIDRLRQVLRPEQFDCECRALLEGALERFDGLESRREARRRLAEARDHKERIGAMLFFLADLDALTETESDPTVFEEMALIFVEIGRSAEAAATALREMQPVGP